MTPIKSITGLPLDPKRLEREEAGKRVKSARSDSSEEARKGSDGKTINDTVEISPQARKISLEQAEIKRYLQDLAQTRTLDDKTAQVIRERISSGFYSKPETVDKIVEVLAKLSDFSELGLSSGRKTERDQKATAEAGNLEEIKLKIQAGEYKSDDVIVEIAERLLNDILDSE